MRTLGITGRVEFEPAPGALAPYLHPGRAAQIKLEGALLGVPEEGLPFGTESPLPIVSRTRVQGSKPAPRLTILSQQDCRR